MSIKWLRALIICFSLSLGIGACYDAVAQVVDEWRAKAALVYNLILFTEWTSGTSDSPTLNVCLLRDSPLFKELNKMNGRTIKGAQLKVLRLAEHSAFAECAVLLLEQDSLMSPGQLKRKLEGLSVLTVLDSEDTGHEGVMVFMSVFRDRIVFDINSKAAQAANISFSSKLLRLARGVKS